LEDADAGNRSAAICPGPCRREDQSDPPVAGESVSDWMLLIVEADELWAVDG
jgi:hypothetical protein